MRNLLGPGTIAGYCTNVHAGASYSLTLANLEAYASSIRKLVCPNEQMGVGLWLAHDAVSQIIGGDHIEALRDWLFKHDFIAYTLNGFPYGNFHEPRVKHKVYHPEWCDTARLDYTKQLADILVHLLPDDDKEGSISTLPIGWRESITQKNDKSFIAAQNLVKLADHLSQIEDTTGKLIHVDLEPEPGCYLDTAQDVVDFFKDELFLLGNEHRLRRYLRVCHDVCHAAVMFESQEHVLHTYKNAGIEVGKVQISSAVRARFDRMDDRTRVDALNQLREFGEDRYLHQTTAHVAGAHMWEDLPLAIAEFDNAPPPAAEWRTHFHVPIFLEKFGLLESTQDEVLRCLTLIGQYSACKHFEVETYAWGVLPAEMRCVDLVEGIAQELKWLKAHAPMK
ncbi:MAG: metabolite traffic protein EboE [Phycisphaeraceae bacterium]